MAKRYSKAREYTEKYRGRLCPCSYCGNTDIQIWSDILSGKYMWSVNCMTEFCDYVWDTSIRRAVERWNEKHGESESESHREAKQLPKAKL